MNLSSQTLMNSRELQNSCKLFKFWQNSQFWATLITRSIWPSLHCCCSAIITFSLCKWESWSRNKQTMKQWQQWVEKLSRNTFSCKGKKSNFHMLIMLSRTGPRRRLHHRDRDELGHSLAEIIFRWCSSNNIVQGTASIIASSHHLRYMLRRPILDKNHK